MKPLVEQTDAGHMCNSQDALASLQKEEICFSGET